MRGGGAGPQRLTEIDGHLGFGRDNWLTPQAGRVVPGPQETGGSMGTVGGVGGSDQLPRPPPRWVFQSLRRTLPSPPSLLAEYREGPLRFLKSKLKTRTGGCIYWDDPGARTDWRRPWASAGPGCRPGGGRAMGAEGPPGTDTQAPPMGTGKRRRFGVRRCEMVRVSVSDLQKHRRHKNATTHVWVARGRPKTT